MAGEWQRTFGTEVGLISSTQPKLATHRYVSGIDAGIKLRPSPQELKTMLPELNHRWETYFANFEDKPLLAMASYTGSVHTAQVLSP